MASSINTEIRAALKRFFQARLPNRKITARSNVKRLCGYYNDTAGWRALAGRINALSAIRQAGLRLPSARMDNVSTIAGIQRNLSKVARTKTRTPRPRRRIVSYVGGGFGPKPHRLSKRRRKIPRHKARPSRSAAKKTKRAATKGAAPKRGAAPKPAAAPARPAPSPHPAAPRAPPRPWPGSGSTPPRPASPSPFSGASSSSPGSSPGGYRPFGSPGIRPGEETSRGRKKTAAKKAPARKPFTPPAAPTRREPKDNAKYLVWYGTNRKPNDANDPSEGYSGARDQQIHLGTCEVFIPKSHKIGSTGSGWWRRLRTGVDDRLKLMSINELGAVEYWGKISAHLKSLAVDERDTLVFVHGYNVSFENAALRAAQIGFDLSIKGAMAFFSWPSQGELGGYAADEASIEASEPWITDFIADFAARSGAARVHIIAHSMGNRGVLRAVHRITTRAEERTGTPFDQIILAAADVDADTFRNLCAAYASVSRRTTLYVSSRDLAVEASRWLHAFPRAGLLPPIMIVPGIDTINVTNADLTALGHGYVAEVRDVLQDMHRLLVHGDPPGRRFGLREDRTETGEPFWIIGP